MSRGMPERATLFMVIIVANAALIGGAMMVSGLRINLTPSFPIGFYKVRPERWAKYDLVMSCLPDATARLAIERGYLANSRHCGGHTPVIKRVMAVEGDVVDVRDRVYVNGIPVENTQLDGVDAQGRALKPAKGELTDSRHVWLLSDHYPASFDSRYFGSVDRSLVLFKVVPLWTF